jgi:Domain of unknown function (DUF4389)
MYAVRLHIDEAPAERDKLSVGLRYFFALPWLFVAALYGIGAFAATIVAWFSIVLGRGYPPAIYEFNARYLRMAARANGYFFLQTDEFPPFDGEPLDTYPVRVDIDPDSGKHDRLSVGLRALYLIPVFICMYVVSIIAYVMAIVAWFSILLASGMSRDVQEQIAKALASINRATGYALLFTDVYPPVWDSEPIVQIRGGGQQPAVASGPTPPAS